MNGSTPASRSLAVLGLLVVLIGLSAVTPASWFGTTSKKQPYKKLDLGNITSASAVAKDTNSDGSISWGEIVTQTLQGASDTLTAIQKQGIDQKSIDELNDPSNLTADFSKNLYLANAYLQQQGITDDATKQKVVSSLMAQEATKIIPTTYTLKDLRIASVESKDTLKIYGNAIAPILQSVISQKIMEEDLTNMSIFAQTKNAEDLRQLVNNKARVDGLLKKILEIEVPPSAVPYHILALNRIALYRDTLDNLSRSSTDPVRGTLSVDSYSQAALLLMRLPNQFSNYFKMHNIVFSTKDAGYIFSTGYTYQ